MSGLDLMRVRLQGAYGPGFSLMKVSGGGAVTPPGPGLMLVGAHVEGDVDVTVQPMEPQTLAPGRTATITGRTVVQADEWEWRVVSGGPVLLAAWKDTARLRGPSKFGTDGLAEPVTLGARVTAAGEQGEETTVELPVLPQTMWTRTGPDAWMGASRRDELNLIGNGAFADGLEGWTANSVDVAASVVVGADVGVPARAGENVCRLAMATTTSRYLSWGTSAEPTAVFGGERFRLSYWCWPVSGPLVMVPRLTEWGPGGAQTQNMAPVSCPQGQWTLVQDTVKTHDDTDRVMPLVGLGSANPDGSVMYVDDVRLVQVP